MLRSVFALGLLTVCVLGQAPPDSPPRPSPGQGPPPPQRGMQPQPELYRPPPEDARPKPGADGMCPTRLLKPTDREWPCKTEFFERDASTPFDTERGYFCLMGDMCYLGPVESSMLSYKGRRNVVARKSFCGPRPCYMQNNANGEEYPTVEECSACTIGPETIKVNGTEYTARFCNKTAEFQMLVANPPWIPQVCRVMSPDGEEEIRQCDMGQECDAGPLYTWDDNAVQWKGWMCSQPPELKKMELPVDPKPGHLMEQMYKHLYMMSEFIAIKGGEIRLTGAQRTIWYVLKLMEQFKDTYDALAEKAESMNKPVKMDKDSPLSPLYDEIIVHIYIIGEQIVPIVDRTYAQDFLKSMASTANWVYGMIDKRETDPGVGEWMGWIGGMMEYFWAAHVETDDTNSPAARGVFRYLASMVDNLHKAIEQLPDGPREEELMALKRFGGAVAVVWNSMTDGPTPPRLNTCRKAAMEAYKAYKNLHVALVKGMPPGQIIDKVVKEYMQPMEFLLMYTGVGDDVKYLYKEAHIWLGLMADNIARMPDRPREMEPLFIDLLQQYKELWFAVTGGPQPVGASPSLALNNVMRQLKKIKFVALQAARRPPPPPPPPLPQPRDMLDQPPQPDFRDGRDERRNDSDGRSPRMDPPVQPPMRGPAQGAPPQEDFWAEIQRNVREMLESEEDEGEKMEESCPKQLWEKKITAEDKRMWRIPDDAYFFPTPDDDMDAKRRK